ncbi:Uu.00g014660.m01.CDS01 [Anthostomella pinea]|uniref:Uu.00g014660.m01.CDS01 n=1 Tax=Anthostomella pinea TaxID=933095 RepID=A0AAI8VYE9_9PEZI|nr:Uu.00g014660.m01.CDS01 [Anthostomella pinea]
MALATAYKQFLAAPDASLLAENSTLHYITTTTSFKGPADIINHVNASRKHLKVKKEDFLSAIEAQHTIAVEVDTTLEFVAGGGPYLPALDDNFLADRTVYIPIMHLVYFDGHGKILQIRRSWDQGALLKQLDIIGKTGRNWPIRDSTEQIRMIQNCVKTSDGARPAQGTTHATDMATRPRDNSTNIMRDPHASLSLFAPRDDADQSIAAVISPRGGTRPRQRDFAEILGDEPVEAPVSSPSAGRQRSESPSKTIAPKAGGSKKFQPSRLFDTDQVDQVDESPYSPGNVKSPESHYRTNPKKYKHFEFADGSDAQDAPRPGNATPQKTKHSSQWDFEDFVTPAKLNRSKSVHHRNDRHWGTEGDEGQEEPAHKPAQAKARRDAETHFDFLDDGTPKGNPRAARPRGATHNTGLGLYQNNLYDEDERDEVPAAEARALGAITNTNLKDRGRDFNSHWGMTDDPSATKPQRKAPVGNEHKKAVKMMDANWSSYEHSPVHKENKPTASKNGSGMGPDRGISIAGDGMGGGKGSNRDWLFGAGDDDDDHSSQSTKAVPGRKQGAAAKSGGFNWDF